MKAEQQWALFAKSVESPDARRSKQTLDIVQVREGATLPRYANSPELDNAMDIFAAEPTLVRAGETVIVPTGFKMKPPLGWGLFILPRSGVSRKTPGRIPNAPGLIDHGYKDEVGVLFCNTGTRDMHIARGERVAQMVLIETPEIVLNVVDDLSGEDRGGGFGSTGQ